MCLFVLSRARANLWQRGRLWAESVPVMVRAWLDFRGLFLPARLLSLVVLLAGCGELQGPAQARLALEEVNGADLKGVPRVCRFRLSGLLPLAADEIWLVEGEVSSVSEGRLRRKEIPKTVEDRRVPLAVKAEGDAWTLAPTVILAPGESYTFVGLGVGRLGTFAVSQDERPLLHRWGSGLRGAGKTVTYCAAIPPSYAGPEVFSPPTEDVFPEGMVPGLTEERIGAGLCASVRIPVDAEGFFLPPTQLEEFLVDPTPVVVDELIDAEDLPLECETEEWDEVFSLGCLRVRGAALEVRVGDGPFLFEVRVGSAEVVEYLLVDHGVAAFGPLPPSTPLEIVVTDERQKLARVELTSAEPSPHLILSELLADPLGPEPQSEWVEIHNVGTAPARLFEYSLWDDGGGVPLPDVELAAGAFAVVVRSDYRPSVDVVPAATSLPVIVESIGQNGLRNSGETVLLKNAQEETISKIPALPGREGQSVARMSPWGADDASAFFLSGAEGPTPGRANVE